MNEQIKTERHERLPDVEIQKRAGMEGSRALGALLKRICTEHPALAYAPGVEDEMNPDRITYIAHRDDADIGMWDGIKHGRVFEGKILIVDPQYHGQGIGPMLRDALFQDNDEVGIRVYPFGQPRSEDPARIEERKQKLVEYYKTWGFVVDTEMPVHEDQVIPMIWKKSAQEQEPKHI